MIFVEVRFICMWLDWYLYGSIDICVSSIDICVSSIYLYGWIDICVSSIYMYAVRFIFVRLDWYLWKFDSYVCRSIYFCTVQFIFCCFDIKWTSFALFVRVWYWMNAFWRFCPERQMIRYFKIITSKHAIKQNERVFSSQALNVGRSLGQSLGPAHWDLLSTQLFGDTTSIKLFGNPQ